MPKKPGVDWFRVWKEHPNYRPTLINTWTTTKWPNPELNLVKTGWPTGDLKEIPTETLQKYLDDINESLAVAIAIKKKRQEGGRNPCASIRGEQATRAIKKRIEGELARREFMEKLEVGNKIMCIPYNGDTTFIPMPDNKLKRIPTFILELEILSKDGPNIIGKSTTSGDTYLGVEVKGSSRPIIFVKMI